MDEKAITKETKKLMEGFAKTIGKVKTSKIKKDVGFVGGFREEGLGEKGDEDFRKRMFDNAKSKDENYIYAEKKKW